MSALCGEAYKVLAARDLGEKWCFACRRRVRFTLRIMAPVDVWSWYEPHPTVKCERGHFDGDLFPGYVRGVE
jgi:hypothetical protein